MRSTDHPLFRIWSHMRERCERPRCRTFHNYGGRGIRVCERWQTFWNFVADMGERPSPSHQLDRIDVNGHYEPGNVRWVTTMEQARNRRTTRLVTFRGETLPLVDWAARAGINRATLRHRLETGWTMERALSAPADARKRNTGVKGVG